MGKQRLSVLTSSTSMLSIKRTLDLLTKERLPRRLLPRLTDLRSRTKLQLFSVSCSLMTKCSKRSSSRSMSNSSYDSLMRTRRHRSIFLVVLRKPWSLKRLFFSTRSLTFSRYSLKRMFSRRKLFLSGPRRFLRNTSPRKQLRKSMTKQSLSSSGSRKLRRNPTNLLRIKETSAEPAKKETSPELQEKSEEKSEEDEDDV